MRLWGFLVVCPLAACVPDASAQPRPAPRDAGRAPGSLGAPRGAPPGALGALGVGGLADRRVGGAYVVAHRADAGAPGRLPREVIREAIRGHMSEVHRCYEAELAIDRNLAGRVSLEFALDAQGAPLTVTVVEDGLDRPQVAACIADYARRWTFPAPGGPMRFTYPFHLRAE